MRFPFLVTIPLTLAVARALDVPSPASASAGLSHAQVGFSLRHELDHVPQYSAGWEDPRTLGGAILNVSSTGQAAGWLVMAFPGVSLGRGAEAGS